MCVCCCWFGWFVMYLWWLNLCVDLIVFMWLLVGWCCSWVWWWFCWVVWWCCWWFDWLVVCVFSCSFVIVCGCWLVCCCGICWWVVLMLVGFRLWGWGCNCCRVVYIFVWFGCGGIGCIVVVWWLVCVDDVVWWFCMLCGFCWCFILMCFSIVFCCVWLCCLLFRWFFWLVYGDWDDGNRWGLYSWVVVGVVSCWLYLVGIFGLVCDIGLGFLWVFRRILWIWYSWCVVSWVIWVCGLWFFWICYWCRFWCYWRNWCLYCVLWWGICVWFVDWFGCCMLFMIWGKVCWFVGWSGLVVDSVWEFFVEWNWF